MSQVDTLQAMFERSGVDHKKPSIPRRWAGFLATTIALGAAMSLPAVAVTSTSVNGAHDYWAALPSKMPTVVNPEHVVFLDKDGREFARFASENRVNTKLSDISPNVVKALLDTEDADFYNHGGYDAKGILRALAGNVISGQKAGGSTITQQLVKNTLVANAKNDADAELAEGRGMAEKLAELKMAIHLEANTTKDEILETYLNTVYFGNGSYGITAASQRYFSKSAKDLTVPEAATLVGVLKSTELYNPITQPKAATDRRDTVLGRMRDMKHISDVQYQDFTKVPIKLTPSTPKMGCAVSKYPYYCSAVLQELLSDNLYGPTEEARRHNFEQGGFAVHTAMDPVAMDAANAAATRALGNDNSAAAGVAVVRPGTGEIVAVGQNRTWGQGAGQTELIYSMTRHQPGSSFKPITLATAMEQGYNPSTKMSSDSPYVGKSIDSPPGGFQNDDLRGYGDITAFDAIRVSSNTFFARLVEQVGVKNTAKMAANLGITSIPDNLTGREGSITLGAYPVSPVQMANAYATFAARGVLCNPTTISQVTNLAGDRVIRAPKKECRQAIPSSIAEQLNQVLHQPFAPGGTASSFSLAGRDAAAKTGTTNNYAATWTVGYTTQYSTAVWVGDPRGGESHPLTSVRAYGRTVGPVFGATVAGPVWKDTMTTLHGSLPNIPLAAPGSSPSTVERTVVPDVRGLDTAAAMTLLDGLGFKVKVSGTTIKNDLQPKDTVVSLAPAAGTAASFREEIVLTLTDGSSTNVELKSGVSAK